MEKSPEYKVRQKKLVIDFRDSLQKNTTYVINFGKAIADVNEGNVLKNFTLCILHRQPYRFFGNLRERN